MLLLYGIHVLLWPSVLESVVCCAFLYSLIKGMLTPRARPSQKDILLGEWGPMGTLNT